MVRYRGNDYYVPVVYGCHEVWVKGFVKLIVIGCAAEVIASHPRSYETGDIVFDPVHYLPLIERNIMTFDQAAPLQGWEFPEVVQPKLFADRHNHINGIENFWNQVVSALNWSYLLCSA